MNVRTEGNSLAAARANARISGRRIATFILGLALPWMSVAAPAAGNGSADTARLPGHVLPALSMATAAAKSSNADEELSLTLVLNRDDEAGFQRELHDVYDSRSPNYRQFLSAAELRDRFGPSQASYAQVLGYLQSKGLRLTQGSLNGLTLTVRGTRTQVEQAFDVTLRDYRIGEKSFRANDTDPALPDGIAAHVQAIAGLSNLATPQPSFQAIFRAECTVIAAVNIYSAMCA